MRRLLDAAAKSLITTAVFFGLLEAAVRGAYVARDSFVRSIPLPYVSSDQYGPTPPWFDRQRILIPDGALIWRHAPNIERTYVDIFSPVPREQDRISLLRRFMPTLPPEFRNNPTWHVSLNSQGFRGTEFHLAKSPPTVRIACIGDSWTFGMNVNQDQTYPSQLAALLNASGAGQTFEVLNFGVLGYSSFQGLQLLKGRVLEFHPDILAIGFGMNDSEIGGYRDKDMTPGTAAPVGKRIMMVAQNLEVYRLLRYAAQVIRYSPTPPGEELRKQDRLKSDPVDYATYEPWTRVSPRDYEANVREMIHLQASAGGKTILLDNELWAGSPYRATLQRISADTHVPLVDSLAIVANERANLAHELEARLGLAPDERAMPAPTHLPSRQAEHVNPVRQASEEITVVFRVYRGAFPVPTAMSIVGNAPQLGSGEPNVVLMSDDGQAGDERAGDGVWSYEASFAAGTRLSYLYTNSGARGRWEGLDVPAIRNFGVPFSSAARKVYLPIEQFGKLYMQADNWHTDAIGYTLIARTVRDAITP